MNSNEYKNGYNSRLEGWDVNMSPYAPNSQDDKNWKHGWLDANLTCDDKVGRI